MVYKFKPQHSATQATRNRKREENAFGLNSPSKLIVRETIIRTISVDMGRLLYISGHLSSITMVKRKQKWIPHELTDKQCLTSLDICSNLLVRRKNDPFLGRLIVEMRNKGPILVGGGIAREVKQM